MFWFFSLVVISGFKVKCRKCLVKEGTVLLQKKDVFCGDCLLEYCRHKFRSTIGKSKLLPLLSSDSPQVPRILVAVSGGSASLAMLDMVREVGMEAHDDDERVQHRTQRYAPAVVHVDGKGLKTILWVQICSNGLISFFLTF